MVRRVTILLVLTLVLVGLPLRAASATTTSVLNLPPGIAQQAQPYLDAMMERMQQMDMTPEQMQMMMADMQNIANELPPGIFLQILKWMPKLAMNDMLALHQQIHQGDLLNQPPGQILLLFQRFVGS